MKFRWFRRQRRDDELDAEIRSHLDEAIRHRVERGESPDEARVNTLREFGNVGLVKEVTRDMWGWVSLERLLQDLRFGARMLRKNPGFSVVAVLTLALGIGVNTALFTVFNAVALRSLPVKEPDQIVKVYRKELGQSGREVSGSATMLSYPEYTNYRDHAQTFSGLTAYADVSLTLGGAEAEEIKGLLVSANYFSVLGAEMAAGRPFAAEEGLKPGASPVVVLSHRFWQRRFGAEPGLIGKTITLNRQPFTVIGITTQDFNGAEILAPDLWMPITMQPQVMPGRDFLPQPNLSWLEVVGRLKPGATPTQAQAELMLLTAQLDLAYPGRKTQIIITPGNFLSDPERRDRVMNVAVLLMAAVGLVLLIACANVANLSLARAATRQKEIAIRLALGAGRLRLVRQLLTESVMIAVLGGSLGLLLAYWTVSALLGAPALFGATALNQLLNTINISPDLRVFAYTLLISVVTGVTFGLAPALQSTKPNLTSALKDEGMAFGRRLAPRARLRDALIVAQVTVCLALLITAGLLVRGLLRAQTLDPGFRTEQTLVTTLDLRQQGYDEARAAAFHQQLGERLNAMPAVKFVSSVSLTPLSGITYGQITLEGSSQELDVHSNTVSPNYFETLGIPLLQGRTFSEQEMKEQTPVALINEAMAGRCWPSESALGKRFKGGATGTFYEVIGIVKSVRSLRLSQVDGPYFYETIKRANQLGVKLLVRTQTNPRALISPLREAVRELDPQIRVATMPLADVLEGQISAPRAGALFAGAVGLLALLLASVGLYGVMSYAVNQRTHEIGIRMALGARKRDVLGLVMRQGMRLVAIGVGLGLGGAAAASQIIGSMLFGVSALDPVAFICVPLFLASIAMLACWIPAQRATKVDPLVALRHG